MSEEKKSIWTRLKQNVKNLTNVLSGKGEQNTKALPAPKAQKYELTNETFEIQTGTKPITLYRIRALQKFKWTHPYEPAHRVERGDLGGFVEKRENLSEELNSWVADNAIVYGDAMVKGNALVRGQASVSGYAVVEGNALVEDLVIVKDFARVTDTAVVQEAITVEDQTLIKNDVYVSGNERVRINKDSKYTVYE